MAHRTDSIAVCFTSSHSLYSAAETDDAAFGASDATASDATDDVMVLQQ